MGVRCCSAIFVGFWPSENDTDPLRLYYLVFLAVVSGVIPIAVSPFLKPLPKERPQANTLIPERYRIPFGYLLSVALIGTTALATFFKGALISVALIVIVIVIPAAILIPGNKPTNAVLIGTVRVEGSGSVAHPTPPKPRPVSPWESGPAGMIRRLDFWLLWFCTFALQSGGLYFVVNSGSMAQDRDGRHVDSATITTMFACAQGCGRLVTGSFSNILVRRGIPRTIYFPIILAGMAMAHFVFSLTGLTALFIGTVLCGISFGSVYPLLVITITEIFGPDRFSSNYMIFDGTPGAVGTVIFGKILSTAVFNAHLNSISPETGAKTCKGDECFWLCHITLGIVQVIATILGIILTVRVREVYQKLSGS